MSDAGDTKHYEMLWDCPHCGGKKNLGLTHRHCPACGAPQPAEARYFPKDDEKVAVENHQYVGADVKCAYCGNPSSRKANNCGGCGAPLKEGQEVQRVVAPAAVSAQNSSSMPPSGTAAPSKKTWALVGCGTLVLAVFVLIGINTFWKKEGAVTVAAQTWTREIAIERFGPVDESKWCDQVPSGASVRRRASEVRSHKQVEDGQECTTQRVDNGDGTFHEKQDCHPKYRDEPEYSDKCYYTINKWALATPIRVTGSSTQTPAWPALNLRAGTCVGCEREGARTETYTVHFKIDGENSKKSTCDFPQARWASFAVGSGHKAKFAGLTGSLDCDSVQ